MKDRLELLSIAKDFNITKNEKGEYEIYADGLGAIIDKNNIITYYMTGCYDSGIDWLEIDMLVLEKLKTFCELLKGSEE